MKIVIPGGTGHVGQSLGAHFRALGHEVVVLSRSDGSGWDGKTMGAWANQLEGADVLINLAGKSVNCRYTPSNMGEMMASRVDSTRILGQAIASLAIPPKLWINSSTATIYQHRFDAANDDATGIVASESDAMPPKWMGSVKIALAWERALFEAPTPKTRKVAIRSAMVMAPLAGSIFDVLLGLAKKGLLGTQGNGRQYVSWIHESDFCRAIQWIIDHPEIEGPLIVASPCPLPQRDFAKTLRDAAGVKLGLPASAWMLEIGAVLLKTETELLLKSRRVVPSRLLETGFEFEFPQWSSASTDLVNKMRS